MRASVVLAAIALAAASARAEPGRLAGRTVDAADGLSPGAVYRIVPDSKGFLWFCSSGGLTRFDGVGFVPFPIAAGGAGTTVRDVLEDADRSTYWVASADGLYRFDGDRPAPPDRLFERIPLPFDAPVIRLLQDRGRRLWIGTTNGLAVLEAGEARRQVRRVLPADGASELSPVLALLEDAEGRIWVGTQADGLFSIETDGSVRQFPSSIRGLSFIRDLLLGPDGRIWCTFFGGIARLRARPQAALDPVDQVFDGSAGLLSADTNDLLSGGSGEILAGSTAGVAELRPDDRGRWRIARTLTSQEGLATDLVTSLAHDPAGNLWLGTVTRGAIRLGRTGFRRYPEVEESAGVILALSVRPTDEMIVLSAVEQRRYRVHHLAAGGHTAIDVRLPEGIGYLGWGTPRMLNDRAGNWWLTTGQGLLLYEALPDTGPERLRRPPDRRFGTVEGLPGADVFAVFEDSLGAIWVSVSEPRPELGSLARRRPGENRFETWPDAIGPVPGDLAIGFADVQPGEVWIGFMSGRLMRSRGGGPPEPVGFDPPLPDAPRRPLGVDSHGRLWLASRGVHVVDDPSATTPRARPGPTELRDVTVSCMAEDRDGRLYFGTPRGVLRIDERRGTGRLFTRADGLPGNDIYRCAADGRGDLWFSDIVGLARLTPGADPELPSPQVRIAAVRVDGAALPVPPLGAAALGPLELSARPHHVAIDLFAISHVPGERLLYQHWFEGGAASWSAPTQARTLEFPQLDPGRHRLRVRLVTPGTGDAAPIATLELVIPLPLWRRQWFLALGLMTTVAVAYAAYRVRLARLLAVERMRTRIATDLHDDVGADLSRISMLADFARRELDGRSGRAPEMLTEVARTARDAVDGMSDIVWALKPSRDELGQVVARLKDFAAELAGSTNVELTVRTGENLERVSLTGEQRRELYLALKEAVTNALRHAGARSLEVEVQVVGRGIVALVRDDGRGFSSAAPGASRGGGHGLDNMRSRVARLGGVLSVESAPQRGTTVRIELPRA